MELSNEFDVSVDVPTAWEVLTDVERIAPCLPGAKLETIDGDEFLGTVKVKVGPIVAQYKGTARFVVRDEEHHTVVLEASGRDTRGQGNANATVRAELTGTDGGAHVSVVTDLNVTGKVAQFGRGVMAEVSTKLLEQFVENLETTVLAAPGDPRAEPESEAEPESGPEAGPAPAATRPPAEPEPIDLLEVAGSSTAKRMMPLLGAVLATLAILGLLRRRRRRRRG